MGRVTVFANGKMPVSLPFYSLHEIACHFCIVTGTFLYIVAGSFHFVSALTVSLKQCSVSKSFNIILLKLPHFYS